MSDSVGSNSGGGSCLRALAFDEYSSVNRKDRQWIPLGTELAAKCLFISSENLDSLISLSNFCICSKKHCNVTDQYNYHIATLLKHDKYDNAMG